MNLKVSDTQEDCDLCGTFRDDAPRFVIEYDSASRKGKGHVRIVMCIDCKYEMDSELSTLAAQK